jgi:chemotaxis protein methyltransferase CheR
VYEHSGIFLGDNRQSLVFARINKRMRQLGLTDPRDYLHVIRADKSSTELGQLLDAISTNVTQFFREERHFTVLQDLMKQWVAQGRQRISIWCAASSSGEEPYTIAMVARETLPPDMPVTILASDISTRVLQAARQGIYREQDLRRVPAPYVRRYFQRGVSSRTQHLVRVKPALRDLVSYSQINLSTPPFHVPRDLDAVFCRNVMIYFTPTLRQKLARNLLSHLRRDGILFLGMAETLPAEFHPLRTREPSVYRKQ